MEILCVPQQPALPVPRTRLALGDERWDCGPFLSYAHRKGLLRRVQPSLRYPGPSPDIPYLELIYPTSKAENESFYQTWFYFGILAECLGLNERPGHGERDQGEAEAKCEALYEQCTLIEDGQSFLDGSKAFVLLQPFFQELAEETDDVVGRLGHLHECFRLTFHMINAIHSEFDESVRFSIAALAEVISTAAFTTVSQLVLKGVPIDDVTRKFYFPWHRLFLDSGGNLESQMLEVGWCISEIERLRHSYQGLGSMYFISQLGRTRTAPRRDHSACTKMLCKAFQIDLGSYELAHVEPGCACREYEINIADIQRVLHNTKFYPILRFDTVDDGKVELSVEEYSPGDSYVALSHVSKPTFVHVLTAPNA